MQKRSYLATRLGESSGMLPSLGLVLLFVISGLVMLVHADSELSPTSALPGNPEGFSKGEAKALSTESWLTGWTHRKSHEICQATNASTDYMIPLTGHLGVGADSDMDFYLGGSDDALFDEGYASDLFGGGVDGEPTTLNTSTQIDIWFYRGSLSRVYYTNTSNGIDYAEPVETDIPTSRLRAHILLVGETYHMYVSDGAGNFYLFTGTNKVNFTNEGIVLQKGSQPWDTGNLGNMFVWVEEGNWFMLYEATPDSVTWAIGLATSADGITWTKYSGNPVLTEPTLAGGCGRPIMPRSGSAVLKPDGKYSLYYHSQGLAFNGIRRAYSTDLKNWTTEGRQEGIIHEPGFATFGDHSIVQFDGKTYLFYTPSDQVSSSQVNVVVGSETMAELLQMTPDGMTPRSRLDFGDVRFTKSDGTSQLSFFMEPPAGNSTTFWLEVSDNLSAASHTVYVYYGNSAAASTSNLNSTSLLLFDDFSSSDEWFNLGGASHTVANGTMTCTGVVEGVVYRDYVTNVTESVGYAFRWQLLKRYTTYSDVVVCNDGINVVSGYLIDIYDAPAGSNTHWYGASAGTWSNIETDLRSQKLAPMTEEVQHTPGLLAHYINNVGVAEVANSTFESGRVGFRQTSSRNVVVDNVVVRRCVSPEPLNGIWGAEEVYSENSDDENPTPTPSSAIQASFEYTIQGNLVAFTDKSYGSIAVWIWNYGDGIGSTKQNPTHQYIASGVYTVSLTVYDEDARSSRAETTINLELGPNFPVERGDEGWNIFVTEDLTLSISALGLLVVGSIIYVSAIFLPEFPLITRAGRKMIGMLMIGAAVYYFLFVSDAFALHV